MREIIVIKPNSMLKHRGSMKIRNTPHAHLEIKLWGINKDEIKILNTIYDKIKHTLSMNGYKFELCPLSSPAKSNKLHYNKERKHAKRHGNRLVVK